ncbi:MAG: mechanosensitive ion channel [Simkaniaceae bacterium]|nr:mechanosensitive ion channel [Simkaniaceae bacterium]
MINPYWTVTLFKIQETPITLTKLIVFVAILCLSFIIGLLVRVAITKTLSFGNQISSSYAISRLVYFFILIVGFYVAFTTIGINLTGIAVVAGALSVGIGFGLQALLNNFVSGILILFEKNVIPGDIIQLESGVIGVVEKINVRCTVIHTSDRKKTIVPNSEIISKKLTNWSLGKKGIYQISIPLSVKREVDKARVKEILLAVSKRSFLSSIGFLPSANLVKLTEGFQEWELIVWLNQKAHKEGKDFSFSHLTEEIEIAMNAQNMTLEKISCPFLVFSSFH